MPAMAFDPLPCDVVAAEFMIKREPEVLVFNGFFISSFKAVIFPIFEIKRDAVDDIAAVAENCDMGGFFDGF